MKLRNKKTGVIKNFALVATNDSANDVTLAQVNEEWEDYEEPKECEYWYIEADGQISQCHKPKFIIHLLDKQKAIGNYFETKEEAEKAVKKLKAWKRLKDARFEFTDFGYNLEEESSSIIGAYGKICFDMLCYEDFSDDLDLLFGGEE